MLIHKIWGYVFGLMLAGLFICGGCQSYIEDYQKAEITGHYVNEIATGKILSEKYEYYIVVDGPEDAKKLAEFFPYLGMGIEPIICFYSLTAPNCYITFTGEEDKTLNVTIKCNDWYSNKDSGERDMRNSREFYPFLKTLAEKYDIQKRPIKHKNDSK